MMKLDIQFYYRNFGVYPPDWPFTACVWPPESGRQLFDTRVSFGLRNAPEMTQRVTAAIVWILHDQGYLGIIGLMDDFAVFADTPEECQRQFDALERLLTELGFLVHPPGAGESKRSERPTQRLVLSGILWDSSSMEMSLDATKITSVQHAISDLRANSRPTLKLVQSAGGLLSWAAPMIDGGRLFQQRLWRATHGVSHKQLHVRLTKSVYLDLDWWDENLERYNGTAHLLPLADRRPAIRIVTDATGDGDIGIFWDGAFIYLNQTQVRQLCPEIPPGDLHVQTWEAAAPLCAFRLFRDLMTGHEIHCLVDNTGARSGFSRGAIRHEPTMCVLRAAFYETRFNNARIMAGWIAGKSNPLADAVSRLHEPHQASRLADLIIQEHDAGRLPGNRRPRLAWLRGLAPDPRRGSG